MISLEARSASAMRYVAFTSAMLPAARCRTTIGDVHDRENVKDSGPGPTLGAIVSLTGRIAVISAVPGRGAFSAGLGETMRSSLPSSQCLVPASCAVSSETVIEQEGGLVS